MGKNNVLSNEILLKLYPLENRTGLLYALNSILTSSFRTALNGT